MQKNKLFLLDAYALIFRAYYAFIKNPRINSKGKNTSAILGFTNSLIDILVNQKPSHIAVVFDYPAQTERAKIFSEYKAHREETPEVIKESVPEIMKIISAFGIPIYMSEGYEADDIIGQLAIEARKNNFETYMMTPDKDYGQVVDDDIYIYKPARGKNPPEILGKKEICEKYQIENPNQLIDILAIWGDSADNIPGIPGIGEKNAIQLISKYGSVENLLKNTSDLKGKQKENVQNFSDQAMLSKKLVAFMLDSPIKFNEDELIIKDFEINKLNKLFLEYEFRTLTDRLTNIKKNIFQTNINDFFDTNIQNYNNIENTSTDYKLITTEKEIDELIALLEKSNYFSFDTETSSLDIHNLDIVGISFCLSKNIAFYINLYGNNIDAKYILSKFKSIFENNKITKIAHNLKFDLSILRNYDIPRINNIFDTMIAHFVLNNDSKHGLDFLSENLLNYKTIKIDELIGKKGKDQISMKDIKPEEVVNYACEDADICLQLYEYLLPKIKEEKLEDLLYNIEFPLIKVLEDMERTGIELDTDFLTIYSDDIEIEITSLINQIKSFTQKEFNIDSPAQLGIILFEELNLMSKPIKTKTGQYSTKEEVIEKLKDKHPIINKLLDYRELKKLHSTYITALPKLINPKTKRLHTNYMQTGTATGRLSSINPNLQNIPIRTEKGKLIRKAFCVKSNETVLLSADYSQIELRIIAGMSNDDTMIEAFRNNEDIHKSTASKVFNIDIENVSREQRNIAKTVNFGIIYGISAFGLSERVGISRKEAKTLIDNYFEKYPKIKEFMDKSISICRERGFSTTYTGRIRRIREINSSNAIVRSQAERNAINSPIQGTSADIIKLAMVKIHEKFEQNNIQSRLLLQIHDELVFEVYKNELSLVNDIIKTEMENVIDFSVPLSIVSSNGNNWLEAH